jgi:hypothetical protein
MAPKKIRRSRSQPQARAAVLPFPASTLEVPEPQQPSEAALPSEVFPLPGRLVNHLCALSLTACNLLELVVALRLSPEDQLCGGLLEKLAGELANGLDRKIIDRAARGEPLKVVP